MRDYHLMIPSDCTVSNAAEENREAFVLMRKFLKADTRPPRDCDCRGREGRSANGRRPIALLALARETIAWHKSKPRAPVSAGDVSTL